MSSEATQFKKGHIPLPGAGRPKNAKDKFSVCELKKAFERAEKNCHKLLCARNSRPPQKCDCGGVSIYDWLAKKAYEDHTLAVALLKKIMPDMRQVEVIRQYEGGYATMTPAEACAAMDAATMGEKPDA